MVVTQYDFLMTKITPLIAINRHNCQAVHCYNRPMIVFKSVNLQRGTQRLLESCNATIQPQKRVAIIGANGCGKSSLFKVLLGEIAIDGGDITFPPNWRLAHMAQEVDENQRSALDYVLDGDTHLRQVESTIEIATHTEDHNALAQAYHELETIDGYTARNRAEQLLHGLGFTQDKINQPVSTFSGGWRIRLNLAQALMCPSDLLLLDEPTNHLDIDATIWLEQWLKTYAGTLLFISHDRDFIDGVADQIFHIEQHSIYAYTGNYSSFEQQRAQRLAQQQASYEKQQQRIKEIHQFVDRFKAKATKARQAQSRLKELQRMEAIAPAHIDSPFDFRFEATEKISDPLLSLEQVTLGYGNTSIVENVNVEIRSTSRIGLLGPNGAGKSTLVKCLVNELQALSGERKTGEHLHIGYFAQHQLEQLDLEASALLHLQRLSPTATEQAIRNFLGRFNFHGDKALDPIAPFSGGEKARLALALIVWRKPNLLILDEPTNHLDLEMRYALTLALQLFEGAVVIISHDRHLLKNTVDEFYLVAKQCVTLFDGDLQGYQQWLRKNLDTDKSPSHNDTPGGDSKGSHSHKKTQRQQNANTRQQRQPLQKAIKRLEKHIEKTQQQLDDIEQTLTNTDLYLDENKAQLQRFLKQQGDLKSQLQSLEVEWEDAYEALEG